jgi:flagellar basal-body rod protein FlgF
MIKGIYSSGSSLRPMMARLEVLANNLANLNTTGFKRDTVFMDILKDAGLREAEGKSELDGLDVRQITDFSEGSLMQTNNPLDVAIQGNGFFVVNTPYGQRYTRNGSFKLAQDGTIVTHEGFAVQGTRGNIQIPDTERTELSGMRISPLGEITRGQASIGKLRIVNFENLDQLTKDHGSLFISTAAERPVDPESQTVAIRQGYLEESNVDGIAEMIEMIEINRNFEASQRALQSQDSTLDKTMEVGRV